MVSRYGITDTPKREAIHTAGMEAAFGAPALEGGLGFRVTRFLDELAKAGYTVVSEQDVLTAMRYGLKPHGCRLSDVEARDAAKAVMKL